MSLHPVHNLVEFLSRPLIGVTTSLGSVIASLLPHLETGMRLGGGIITNISVLVSGGGTNTLQFSNGILTNVTSP